MNSFSMTPDKVYEANAPFTDDRGYVNFAKIKDGILYVYEFDYNLVHDGYLIIKYRLENILDDTIYTMVVNTSRDSVDFCKFKSQAIN